MMSESENAPREKNLVPVIERMLDILESLERRPAGASIRSLCEELDMPRSTVYRILNTLALGNVVRQASTGTYVLGPRLISLAAKVVPGPGVRLVEIARPYLEKLSRQTGEASKLSIRDDDRILVAAVTSGSADYGLSLKPGRRLALHAGAASKVLLAYVPKRDADQLLAGPLERFTTNTIVDPARLRQELDSIRRQGWAIDRGEHSVNVHAVAAPIRDGNGNVVAAISIPFLSNPDKTRMEYLRKCAIATAAAISDDLRGQGM